MRKSLHRLIRRILPEDYLSRTLKTNTNNAKHIGHFESFIPVVTFIVIKVTYSEWIKYASSKQRPFRHIGLPFSLIRVDLPQIISHFNTPSAGFRRIYVPLRWIFKRNFLKLCLNMLQKCCNTNGTRNRIIKAIKLLKTCLKLDKEAGKQADL
jgi:hypothetical protein